MVWKVFHQEILEQTNEPLRGGIPGVEELRRRNYQAAGRVGEIVVPDLLVPKSDR
jgi:hypothetical protein